MFGITNNLDGHLEYTRNEWFNSQYYKKVLDYLIEKGIKNYIDVGACSGGISDVFFENIPTLEKSIMIEAMPQNYNYIVNRYKDEDNRTVINKAMYYGKSSINMGSVGGNVGAWSFQSNTNSIEVKTITLEDVLEENKHFTTNIDFIKIDIEGAEYNVLEHSKVLKDIPFIEIEFHNNNDYGVIEGETRHKTWGAFCEKYLPNHKLLYGGENQKFLWPNGQEVVYDGSGFFVLKNML